MSGQDVKASAAVATGAAAAGDPGTQMTSRGGRGQEYAGARFVPAGRSGRPPGLTTIEDDETIKAPVRAMRRDGRRRITQSAVVAYAGTFTISELRGYLHVTGRIWREFLRSF